MEVEHLYELECLIHMKILLKKLSRILFCLYGTLQRWKEVLYGVAGVSQFDRIKHIKRDYFPMTK